MARPLKFTAETTDCITAPLGNCESNEMKRGLSLAYLVGSMAAGTSALAQDVRITTFKSESRFELNGQSFTIARNQDSSATLQGPFARTSRACPPDCIQPMVAATGVPTVAELEVLAFIETQATNGTGLVIDTRLPEAFAEGAIPGAVNVPYITMNAQNRYRTDILRALGATDGANGTLDFSEALDLVLYCGGAWSNTTPTAIEDLLAAGYPPEKLHYYRGGMQAWLMLGLTTSPTDNQG